MANKTLEELKVLRGKVDKLVDTIKYYADLFAADGNVDAKEQAALDKLNATVKQIEAKIDEKEATLNFGQKLANKSAEVTEDIADFFSKKDDIVDHSLVDQSLVTETTTPVTATTTETTTDETTTTETTTTETTTPTETTTTPPVTTPDVTIVGSVIKKSVGEKGNNEENDVKIVQKLLEVAITGNCDKKTILAITKFQLSLGFKSPDGLIGAGGTTWKALTGGKVEVLSDTEIDELIDSSKVKAILGSVHNSEGGYVDDPNDAGGKTKYGIAETREWPQFAAMFDLDASKPELIKDITKDQVDEYYIRTRLTPLGIPSIKSTKISNALFDQSILTPSLVKKNLRRSLNKLGNQFPVSNDNFTAEELEAINNGPETKILEGFVEFQNAYYRSLGQDKFLRGWLNRTARLLDFKAPVEDETTSTGGDDTTSTPVNDDTTSTTTNDDTTSTPVNTGGIISDSVGKGGKNKLEDVKIVQALLKNLGYNLGTSGPNGDGVDGDCGATTIKHITDFQKKNFTWTPDGLISTTGNTWKKLSGGTATTTDPVNTDTGNDNTNDTPMVEGKYFSHPNAENVTINYGANAVKMNSQAEHLAKSIAAEAGLSSIKITSTLRTYADQARINYNQNSGSQIKQWYGTEVYNTWKKYKDQGKSTADYAKYLEDRDKARGRVMSKHLSGLCLDVAPHNSKFSDVCARLKPISGSGLKTYLVEKGCTHTEFTFKVC